MENRRGDKSAGERPVTRPHEEYLELCAISTSGDLTSDEQNKLKVHLADCPACRQALKEFEAAVDLGVPLLFPELATIASECPNAEARETPTATRNARIASERSREISSGAIVSGHRNYNGRTHVNWNYVWMSLAAGILLTVALGLYSYEVGKSRSLQLVRLTPIVTDARVETLEQKMSDAGHERSILEAQLADRNRVIAELRRKVDQESASLSEIKSAQANLERLLQGQQEKEQLASQERTDLTQRLDSAQATLQKTQVELGSVRQLRTEDQLRASSLEDQMKGFANQLRERDQTINKQEELLAHDRDIRELMGARDLYIAEVYDVARDGATQKPYGRVFYTKGKSLVFYAYDLDQQASAKNTATFQAWGRRGSDKEQALNLGIFYEDSAAKKRWILKSDNARTLEQIDAVFVTVEPNGGSHKPSGKPLLFAYLKVDPNHP